MLYHVYVSISYFTFAVLTRVRLRVYSFVCGVTKETSALQTSALKAMVTSIKETPREKTILNTAAICLLVAISFLFGYFA